METVPKPQLSAPVKPPADSEPKMGAELFKLEQDLAGEAALPATEVTGAPQIQIGKAVKCALLSSAIFSVMFALIKLLGKDYPSGEVLFARSFFAIIPLLPMIIKNGGFQVFATKKPVAHLTRSAMGLISAFLCIDALRLLPLSEATCFFYTAPLLTTLLSAFLLKEKITLSKGLAVLSGFLGVLYMMQPKVSDSLTGAFIALGSALFSGFVAIELRRLSESEKSITIVCYFMTACTIAGLLTMPFQFTAPNLQDAIILVLVGVTGGIAQMFMTDAYKYAPASTVAPLNYISLIWATALDAALFGKFPEMATLIGAVVVAASGIFVVRPAKPKG